MDAGRRPTLDERWSALRATRRAQGLCMRCGGKWSRDHQCPAAVQLHVVQELLDVFREATPMEAANSVQEPEPEQLFLSLSVAAVTGMVQP